MTKRCRHNPDARGPGWRRFSGQWFREHMYFRTARGAQAEAENARSQGFNARIIKLSSGVFQVYVSETESDRR